LRGAVRVAVQPAHDQRLEGVELAGAPGGVAAREAASRCAMEVAFEPGFLRISRFAGGRTRLCPALAREML